MILKSLLQGAVLVPFLQRVEDVNLEWHSMDAKLIDPRTVRNICGMFIDANGNPCVVPAADFAKTTCDERAVLGMQNAIYGFITHELVQYLRDVIGQRSAMEIGSGNGILAKSLGIRATDSRMQERPEIRAYYQSLRQAVIRYGDNVEKLDAVEAVKRYRPQVVVANWVTHKYDPDRHEAGGNIDGVCEEDIIKNCDAYVFIGNEKVHSGKSIWSLPHEKITPPWLYSRAYNGSPNFIAIWKSTTPF